MMLPILLQSKEVPQGKLLFLCIAIVIALIFGMFVVMQVKKRIQQSDEPVTPGFTLSDLRRLHKEGQMSDEEFEKAKAKMVEAIRRAEERRGDPKKGPGR